MDLCHGQVAEARQGFLARHTRPLLGRCPSLGQEIPACAARRLGTQARRLRGGEPGVPSREPHPSRLDRGDALREMDQALGLRDVAAAGGRPHALGEEFQRHAIAALVYLVGARPELGAPRALGLVTPHQVRVQEAREPPIERLETRVGAEQLDLLAFE